MKEDFNPHQRRCLNVKFAILKQYRQCTCNVTLRCVHETTVAVGKQ
jgi:hypothetical protein